MVATDRMMDSAQPASPTTMDDKMVANRSMGSMAQMQGEFAGGAAGAGGNRQAARLLGRDGVMRVAQGISRIKFDPDNWLAQYGGYTDREPGDALKARLTQTLLPVPPTQAIASGTVRVAYLRTLTLDPAYQLK